MTTPVVPSQRRDGDASGVPDHARQGWLAALLVFVGVLLAFVNEGAGILTICSGVVFWVATRPSMSWRRHRAVRTPGVASGAAAPQRYGTCLHCHAALAESPQGGALCTACGRHDLPGLHRVYWTLEKRLVRLERMLKAGVILLALSMVAALLFFPPTFLGVGGGWFLAAPVAVFVALWQTAGKLTQHVAAFNARLFWTVACTLFALLFAWLLLVSDGASLEKLGLPPLLLRALVPILAVLAAASWWAGERFQKWKERHRVTPLAHA